VERGEQVTLAFLLLLERLTPDERATYVLHEAFAFPDDAIGAILGKSTDAVRQHAHRARKHIAAGRPRFQVSTEAQRHLTERFLIASRTGDLGALTEILAADVTAWIEGGAGARAARRPIQGRDAVARWLVGLMAKAFPGTRASFADINGGVALLLWSGNELESAATVDVAEGRIQALRFVVNPDKLAYLRRRTQAPADEAVCPGGRQEPRRAPRERGASRFATFWAAVQFGTALVAKRGTGE
jgi:RNA polymerase sigma-70 factor, ECF subfamily